MVIIFYHIFNFLIIFDNLNYIIIYKKKNDNDHL